MPAKKRKPTTAKVELHLRNKHRQRYDLELLAKEYEPLAAFVKPNKYGDVSVDFFNPKAVKALNTALLFSYYNIEHWDIPPGYLCPPVPGRADHVHHAADLLTNAGKVATGDAIKCLDLGVGANCIYPIIGHGEYSWSFVGCDVDPVSIKSAEAIVKANKTLNGHVELRLQPDAKFLLKNIIQQNERFDLVLCNPPFHASAAEAQAGTRRKLNNLKRGAAKRTTKNFGGQQSELWRAGGERQFVGDLITESAHYANTCFWFTSLVSKERNLDPLRYALRDVQPEEVRILPMGQGNKKSRILAWTFLDPKQQTRWKQERWSG